MAAENLSLPLQGNNGQEPDITTSNDEEARPKYSHVAGCEEDQEYEEGREEE